MSEVQSKYPLIRKEQFVKTVWTLEGKEVSKTSHGRTVKPAKALNTKEEIDAYIDQMAAARMHYSNIMDLPYCVEYPVGLNHPLYEYAVQKQDCLPAKNDKAPVKKTAVDADLIIMGELGELDTKSNVGKSDE
jgi:hypothetical protein